jgi:hypothetical protein
MAIAAVAIAAPASNTTLEISQITEPASKYNVTAAAESANCPKATRYACGQYMLEDGTRQDFVSQVRAIPSYQTWSIRQHDCCESRSRLHLHLLQVSCAYSEETIGV